MRNLWCDVMIVRRVTELGLEDAWQWPGPGLGQAGQSLLVPSKIWWQQQITFSMMRTRPRGSFCPDHREKLNTPYQLSSSTPISPIFALTFGILSMNNNLWAQHLTFSLESILIRSKLNANMVIAWTELARLQQNANNIQDSFSQIYSHIALNLSYLHLFWHSMNPNL